MKLAPITCQLAFCAILVLITAACDQGPDTLGDAPSAPVNGALNDEDPGMSPEGTDPLVMCLDNDGDGYVDCADFDCPKEDPEIDAFCAGTSEEDTETCADGIDNDGNGYIDCADFSCSQSANPLVRGLCQESLYRPLAGSTPTAPRVDACESSDEPNCDADKQAVANFACSDEKDNDGDGYVDCDDFDCAWNPLVTVCDGPRVCE
mgnify:CR=1 FL=1